MVGGWDTRGINWDSDHISGKTSSPWGQSSSGTGCPERFFLSLCFGSWKHDWIMMWEIWSDLGVGLETSWGPSSGAFQCYYELTNMVAICTILIKHFTCIFLSHWRSRQICRRRKTLTWITSSLRNYSEYIKTKCKNTSFEFIFLNCVYRNDSKGQRVSWLWHANVIVINKIV